MINISGDYYIFSYSREEAIEDGILVDVSETAKEAGIKCPVAVTASVWTEFIEWTKADSNRQTAQVIQDRLWDVLSMLSMAAGQQSEQTEILFKLLVIPRDGKKTKPCPVVLKAVLGFGDHHEPVITIMLPDED